MQVWRLSVCINFICTFITPATASLPCDYATQENRGSDTPAPAQDISNAPLEQPSGDNTELISKKKAQLARKVIDHIDWKLLFSRVTECCTSQTLNIGNIKTPRLLATICEAKHKIPTRLPLFCFFIAATDSDTTTTPVLVNDSSDLTDDQFNLVVAAVENIFFDFITYVLRIIVIHIQATEYLVAQLSGEIQIGTYKEVITDAIDTAHSLFCAHIDGAEISSTNFGITLVEYKLQLLDHLAEAIAYMLSYSKSLVSNYCTPSVFTNRFVRKKQEEILEILCATEKKCQEIVKKLFDTYQLQYPGVILLNLLPQENRQNMLSTIYNSTISSSEFSIRSQKETPSQLLALHSFEPTVAGLSLADCFLNQEEVPYITGVSKKEKALLTEEQKEVHAKIKEMVSYINRLCKTSEEDTVDAYTVLIMKALCSEGNMHAFTEMEQWILKKNTLSHDVRQILAEFLNQQHLLQNIFKDIEEYLNEHACLIMKFKNGAFHQIDPQYVLNLKDTACWASVKSTIDKVLSVKPKADPVEEDADQSLVLQNALQYLISTKEKDEALRFKEIDAQIDSLIKSYESLNKDTSPKASVAVKTKPGSKPGSSSKRQKRSGRAQKKQASSLEEPNASIDSRDLPDDDIPATQAVTPPADSENERLPSKATSDLSTLQSSNWMQNPIQIEHKYATAYDPLRSQIALFYNLIQNKENCWIAQSVRCWMRYENMTELTRKAFACHDLIDVLSVFKSSDEMAEYFTAYIYKAIGGVYINLSARANLYLTAPFYPCIEKGFFSVTYYMTESLHNPDMPHLTLFHLRLDSEESEPRASLSLPTDSSDGFTDTKSLFRSFLHRKRNERCSHRLTNSLLNTHSPVLQLLYSTLESGEYKATRALELIPLSEDKHVQSAMNRFILRGFLRYLVRANVVNNADMNVIK